MEFDEDEFRSDIKKIKGYKLAKDIAREEGVYISDGKFHNFLLGFFIISIVLCFSIFLWLVYEGKLQAVQEVVLNPNFNATIYNEYQNNFDNVVNNDYEHEIENNFTIYNNIIVEECES